MVFTIKGKERKKNFSITIEPRVMDEFRTLCRINGFSVSHSLNEMMKDMVTNANSEAEKRLREIGIEEDLNQFEKENTFKLI